jgi:hypothetical protein
MADAVEITVEGTPNPNAAKFTLNRVVATQGTTYRDPASAPVEWAKRILSLPGVAQVFAVNNFISVTKRPEADWHHLAPQVEQVLQEAFG